MALATVAFWHDKDGWGAITAPDRPGVGFVHFANITGIDGYRNLRPGSSVEFEWLDDFEQDGCQWRAAWVRPHVATEGDPHEKRGLDGP
jgi:cold shock CspA family protein